MITPKMLYSSCPVGQILALEHGRLPTTDIYLRPRLDAPGMPPANYVDISQNLPNMMAISAPPEGTGLFVVIYRYVTGPWLKWLESRRDRLAGVAFFTDDDLPAMLHDGNLPLRYRLKIWRLYGRHARGLSALTSELWVSSAALAARYADASPRLIPPLQIGNSDRRGRVLRYFYYGTAAHGGEVEWLRDVVAMVQARNDRTTFEIVGDHRVRDLYRGIARVTVLHPMDWPNYLAHTETTRQDIGLAPLLPGTVNEARAHTRFYDITRTGAVGLYTDRPPYAGFVRDCEDGLLLPDDKIAWVEAILGLVEDEPYRRRMAEAASLRVLRRDDALAHLSGRAESGPEAAE
jgi:hypothetical protein